MKNKCIDCGKEITEGAKRCGSCARKNNGKVGAAKCSITHIGMGHTKETKDKLRKLNLGRKLSKETKDKISKGVKNNLPSTAFKKGMPKEQHTNYGKRGKNAFGWRGGKGVARGRISAKRRSLGFIPLNDKFEGSDAHHINKEFIIYIPAKIHKSVSHNVFNGRNMDKINDLAINYIFKDTKITIESI